MHGGNLKTIVEKYNLNARDVIDFSVSVNPLGFPGETRKIISQCTEALVNYPDPDYREFAKAIADYEKICVSQLVPGNGSSELLYFILAALDLDEILIPSPAYIDYEKYACQLRIQTRFVDLNQGQSFEPDFLKLRELLKNSRAKTALLMGVPNNPTGGVPDENQLKQLIEDFPRHFFIFDLAYYDISGLDLALFKNPGKYQNVILIKSLTKLFAVPGVRMAYALMCEKLALKIKESLPVWNVNSFAERLGCAFLENRDYIKKTIAHITFLKEKMSSALQEYKDISIIPGKANFILFHLDRGDPGEFYKFFAERGLILRWCHDYRNLDERYFRIGLRREDENNRLLDAFDVFFQKTRAVRNVKKKKPALMFQGTSSNAGKSLMTAAFCRVLHRRGFSVAPFKAQNMSLNSAVSFDGGEVGRAQALQARAAGISVHTDMNPVLLKPNSDTGAQVIVNGKVWQNLEALDYYASKNYLRDQIHAAYDRLSSQYDVVILEGAGSPGEVNLKQHDMVNMHMACYANSNVILVGDIDRGGVYASFIGHLEVMEEWERRLVQGFIVNKFRGDASLLKDAHEYVFDYCGKGVIGIMPYLKDHRLPEEDGVDFEERYGGASGSGPMLNVGVLELTHISNSTDIDPILDYSQCRLIKIRTIKDLQDKDIHLLIIPGSKNVISDFRELENARLTDEIKNQFFNRNLCVLGICGGFQMLGENISDPMGIESKPGTTIRGLGLLAVNTVLAETKSLSQRTTQCLLNKKNVQGYEIHHGVSRYERELFSDVGLGTWSERIWGSYLHGICENHDFLEMLLKETARAHNLEINCFHRSENNLDMALDSFADCFEENVDLRFLLKATGL
ncbi:MAG: cobyric acid synthase [Spirochaetales bacterium]|nr:cobyric acid synthase [Spirochaetales bacterium]